jgi:hypothetical protein
MVSFNTNSTLRITLTYFLFDIVSVQKERHKWDPHISLEKEKLK